MFELLATSSFNTSHVIYFNIEYVLIEGSH